MSLLSLQLQICRDAEGGAAQCNYMLLYNKSLEKLPKINLSRTVRSCIVVVAKKVKVGKQHFEALSHIYISGNHSNVSAFSCVFIHGWSISPKLSVCVIDVDQYCCC